jgi:hypothetical protein
MFKMSCVLVCVLCGGRVGTQRFIANWIGPILRRNCLLKEVIEGKIN